MAIPQIPGVPTIDPITGQMIVPGEAAPTFPPAHWFADPNGVAPTEFVGQDVPLVDAQAPPPPMQPQAPPLAPELQGGPGAPQAPPEAIPPQAAPEQPPVPPEQPGTGPPQLAEAKAQGSLIESYPEAERQSTGDPYLDAMAIATDEARAANRIGTEAAIRKNQAESEQGLSLAKEVNRRQAEADKAYMQTYNAAKLKRSQLEAEAIANANTKIDPRRIYHDMSTPQKIVMGVMAALTGATTRAVQTGQNSIVAMLDQMAERDMKAQQMEMENRGAMLQTRRGFLADDLAAGRDLLDVQYKSVQTFYENGRNAIKAYCQQFDNDALTAQGMKQDADITAAQAQASSNFLMARQAQDLDAWSKRQQAAIGWKNADTNAKEADARLKAAEGERGPKAADINAAREMEKDRRERIILQGKTKDGKQLYAKDSEAATEINKVIDETTKSSALLDELTDIYSRNHWNPLGSWRGGQKGADAQRANFLTTKLYSNFSQHEGQGTVRDSEYKMYREAFGDPTGIRDPRQLFGSIRQTFIDDVNDTIGPGQLDEQGNVVEGGYWQPKSHLKKPDAETQNDDNPPYQARPFERVPMDKTGKILTPEEDRAAQEAARPPRQSAAEWEGEQRSRFEMQRRANIKAVQGGVRSVQDLPYPQVGLSGMYKGGRVN